MNTRLLVIGVAAFSVAAAATTTETHEVTVQKDAWQDATFACNSPDITAAISENSQAKGDNWVDRDIALKQKGKCVGFPGGSRFQIIKDSTARTQEHEYPAFLAQDLEGGFGQLYVLRRNIVEFTADDLKQREATACGNAVNGEVARWVTTADGTLKLKRFMITSKCVDGKMRSFSKPLN